MGGLGSPQSPDIGANEIANEHPSREELVQTLIGSDDNNSNGSDGDDSDDVYSESDEQPAANQIDVDGKADEVVASDIEKNASDSDDEAGDSEIDEIASNEAEQSVSKNNSDVEIENDSHENEVESGAENDAESEAESDSSDKEGSSIDLNVNDKTKKDLDHNYCANDDANSEHGDILQLRDDDDDFFAGELSELNSNENEKQRKVNNTKLPARPSTSLTKAITNTQNGDADKNAGRPIIVRQNDVQPMDKQPKRTQTSANERHFPGTVNKTGSIPSSIPSLMSIKCVDPLKMKFVTTNPMGPRKSVKDRLGLRKDSANSDVQQTQRPPAINANIVRPLTANPSIAKPPLAPITSSLLNNVSQPLTIPPNFNPLIPPPQRIQLVATTTNDIIERPNLTIPPPLPIQTAQRSANNAIEQPSTRRIATTPLNYNATPQSSSTVTATTNATNNLNNCVDISLRQCNVDREKSKLELPSFVTEPQKFEPLFGLLFDGVCRTFLWNDCQLGDRCRATHRWPENGWFRATLEKYGVNDVLTLYDQFLMRNQFIFDKYFCDVVDYCSAHGLRDKLHEMSNECNKRDRQDWFPMMVKAFTQTGLTYSKSTKRLIQSLTSQKPDALKWLVNVILDHNNDDIAAFLPVLETCVNKKFSFPIHAVNRMMAISVRQSSEKLKQIVASVLKEATGTFISRLDTKLLKAFCPSESGDIESTE